MSVTWEQKTLTYAISHSVQYASCPKLHIKSIKIAVAANNGCLDTVSTASTALHAVSRSRSSVIFAGVI